MYHTSAWQGALGTSSLLFSSISKTMMLLLYKNALHSKYCLQHLATVSNMNKGKANVEGLMQHQTGSFKCFSDAEGQVVMLRARTVKCIKVLGERVTERLSVRSDALLSEFFHHSHQVSGVWVPKTTRPSPY